jgi:hypothetical protein
MTYELDRHVGDFRAVKFLCDDGEFPPMTIELFQRIRNVGKADIFVVGPKIAEHFYHTLGKWYFDRNGSTPFTDYFDLHASAQDKERGYLGMLLGLDIVTRPDLDPFLVAGVELKLPPIWTACHVTLDSASKRIEENL